MPAKDPFTFHRARRRFPSMETTLRIAANRPFTGVTQGGSSRRNSGAIIAATEAEGRRKRRKKDGYEGQ